MGDSTHTCHYLAYGNKLTAIQQPLHKPDSLHTQPAGTPYVVLSSLYAFSTHSFYLVVFHLTQGYPFIPALAESVTSFMK